MNKKIILIIILIISLGIAFILFNNRSDKFSYQLKKQGIIISEIEGFKIIKKGKDNISASNGESIIKIKFFKDITSEESNKIINEKTSLLHGLFEPQLPPYPEFLTKETGCDERFKPIKKEGQFGNYYLTYANQRFGYGICADDLVKYKAALGFFYCPQKENLFKLEYFISQDKDFSKISNLMESFSCL